MRIVLCLLLLAGCLRSPEVEEYPAHTETDPYHRSLVTPHGSYAVRTEPVRFEAAGVTVHGTLLVPDVLFPAPAVLLLADGGMDRNWESPRVRGRNGSGRLLADALARRGVAVLRYDQRGTGETATDGALSWSDLLAEQRAALSVLAEHPDVAGDQVFVLGHGQGGLHALRLGSEESVAGIGLLATSGHPMRDVLVGRLRDSGFEAEALDPFARALDAIVAGEAVVPEDVTVEPALQGLLHRLQDPASLAYHRELLAFDPTAAVGSVHGPVLVVAPGKDLQVAVGEATRLEEAARAAGLVARRIDVPDADHALKTEERPLGELDGMVALSYNSPQRTLNPEVVAAVVGWLRGHTATIPVDAFEAVEQTAAR